MIYFSNLKYLQFDQRIAHYHLQNFLILCAVDGKWGRWGPFGPCKACKRQRKRLCDDPPPSNGGAKCSGNKMVQYHSQQCPANWCGKFLTCVYMTMILYYIYVRLYMYVRYIFLIGCVKDVFPKGLRRDCRKKYPCAKLARKGLCRRKYSQAMSIGCKNQITKYWQNRMVEKSCKKSCNNCKRTFLG